MKESKYTDEQRKRRQEACRRYRAKHPDRVRATKLVWTRANAEKCCARSKDYYRRNKDRALVANRCSRHRIKRSEFAAMVERQGNACAICRVSFSEACPSHIDHDHETGAVRGLLCQNCNHGVGCFRDSVDYLKAAGEYLQIFRAIEAAEAMRERVA